MRQDKSMKRPLAQLLHTHAARQRLRSGQTLPHLRELFELVRDMPYARASSHHPETIISEWRGTCSTKHELLVALYAEIGLHSTLYACTQEIRLPQEATSELAQWKDKTVIDIHNYMVLHRPEGDLLIDATWPLVTKQWNLPANEWGENMQIACKPLETWALQPEDNVEEFKTAKLKELYTPEQLKERDLFIEAIGNLFMKQASD